MKKFLWIFLSSISFYFITSSVYADTMDSDSYVITFGNFNITSGEKDSASYQVTDTVGQTGAGPYDSSNYFVGGGFQYIYQIPQFSFTISNVNIALGLLTPGVHSSSSNQLTINTRGAGGYTVYTYETKPLTHSNGSNFIADTTCDAGGCSETTAAIWSNHDIPGFGYNANGDDVVSDFIDNSYFKQFANDQGAESMQAIMQSNDIASSRTATITYKAGVSGTQEAGSYENAIIFIAVPGY